MDEQIVVGLIEVPLCALLDAVVALITEYTPEQASHIQVRLLQEGNSLHVFTQQDGKNFAEN